MYVFNIGSLAISVVDIVIFVICMISAVFCCIRGFVMELSKWAGLFVGLLVAIMFCSTLSPVLSGNLPWSLPAPVWTVISFLVLWLAGFLVIFILGNMLRKIVETFNLGAVDNLLGFIFGLAVSLLAIGVIVYLLTKQPVFDFSSIINSSVIIRTIIVPMMPQAIQALGFVTEEGLRTLTEAANAV